MKDEKNTKQESRPSKKEVVKPTSKKNVIDHLERILNEDHEKGEAYGIAAEFGPADGDSGAS